MRDAHTARRETCEPHVSTSLLALRANTLGSFCGGRYRLRQYAAVVRAYRM